MNPPRGCASNNQINTGIPRPGFPSAGSWVTYGLGSENHSLPGFVVLGNKQGVKGGNLNWSSGFLPTTYQGTLFRPDGTPVNNLNCPSDVERADQRRQLDLLAKLNATHLAEHLMGIDHKELTYFYNGRRYRLTDVADTVIDEILA